MFDPFDSSAIQESYGKKRFTSGKEVEREAMADFTNSFLQGGMEIEAAKRSAKWRVTAAERAAKYRKQQAKPSTGQKIASGIGVAASVTGIAVAI